MMSPTPRRGMILAAAGLALCTVSHASMARAQCDKPALLVILDKSSSMVTGTVPTGETKWEAARIAIARISTMFQDSIDFGLMVFPYPNQCNPGQVVIPVGPGNSDAINDYMADPPPTGGNWTPMAQSLEAAAAYPPMSDTSLRRVAVLVTDGWQWCDPYDPATRFDPVDAAAMLRATGTTVHVVGFGDGVDPPPLNQIAYQSGTYILGCNPGETDPLAGDNCYHQAMGIDSLSSALETIARHATEEVCDGLDNDCDDQVDEGLTRACFTLCGSGTETCVSGGWTGCSAPQPADEICDGWTDEDCDGIVDEGCQCTEGESRPCGLDVGECVSGTQTCSGGSWGGCAGATGPSEETCDGLDNDCNGTVDEGCLCAEGDTRPCGIEEGACQGGTQTCLGGAWGGCTGATEPSPETCNSVDDDCDGVVDEGCLCPEGETRPCGNDVGTCRPGEQICTGGVWSGCEGAVWPSEELCDGQDNDCNGVADNDAMCPAGQQCIEGSCVGSDNPMPEPEPDGGTPVDNDEKPGCGCVVAGRSGPQTALPAVLLLLAGLLIAALRRRDRGA
jgi:hypothetical protein